MLQNELTEDSQTSTSTSTTSPKSEKKLALYRWQVAGTLPMFYKDGRVYKPSPEREINFYLKIPAICHQIIPFIPKFYQVHHKLSVNYDFYGSNHNHNNVNHSSNHNLNHSVNNTSIQQNIDSNNKDNVSTLLFFLCFFCLFSFLLLNTAL